MLKTIWERYIFKKFLNFFALFIFGFYFLYVLVDLSMHMQEFFGKGPPIWKILIYYAMLFIKRADILFPLALLLGTITTLFQLNSHRELLAFQTAGIEIKKLLRPFFLVGSLCVVLNLAINEFTIPYSLGYVNRFYDAYLRHSYSGNRSEPLHVLHLDDHSKLVYQYYDTAKEAFFDVIWIRSGEDIWKMKYLNANPESPIGSFADHIKRGADGFFEKVESYPSHVFTDLQWSQNIPRKGYIPNENRALSDLWKKYLYDKNLSQFESQAILSHFLFKCAMPFLSLISIIAIVPFSIRYSRNQSQFFIYALTLFGYIAFVAFMDAMMILGESGAASPYMAILFPFIVLSCVFGWRFTKTT